MSLSTGDALSDSSDFVDYLLGGQHNASVQSEKHGELECLRFKFDANEIRTCGGTTDRDTIEVMLEVGDTGSDGFKVCHRLLKLLLLT